MDMAVVLHAVNRPGTECVAGSPGHRGVETRSSSCAMSVDNLCACRLNKDICTNDAILISQYAFIFCKKNVDKLWDMTN